MNLSEPILIAAFLTCIAIAIVGLFRPILGLLVFLAMHFSQPGEMIPALAPFRIELIYGILIFGTFAYRRASVRGPALLSDRIVLAAVLFLGAGVLSVPFAIWRGGAFDAVIYLAKLIALLLLLSGLIETNDQLRKVLWLLVGLLVWFTGTGLFAYSRGEYYQLNYQLGNIDRAKGVNSLVGGPNELAGLILTLLPFLWVMFRSSRNHFIKLALVACGGLALITMVLTGSRSAMIGLGAVIVYYLWNSKRRVLNSVACLVLACVAWFSMPSVYQQRFLTVKSYAEGGKLDDSNAYRLEVWRIGWKMFTDHPVLGVGAGQFPTAFGTAYSSKEHGAWMNPHNLLIQVACELGVVGLAAFAYFLFQITKAIRSVIQLRGKPKIGLNYHIALACNAMLLAVLIISVVGHSLYRPYWYLLAGLAAANRSLAFGRLRKLADAIPEQLGRKQQYQEYQNSLGTPYPHKSPS